MATAEYKNANGKTNKSNEDGGSNSHHQQGSAAAGRNNDSSFDANISKQSNDDLNSSDGDNDTSTDRTVTMICCGNFSTPAAVPTVRL